MLKDAASGLRLEHCSRLVYVNITLFLDAQPIGFTPEAVALGLDGWAVESSHLMVGGYF